MTGLLSLAGSTPSDSGFELKSCRFDDGDTPYLSRTPTVAGNRKTWTWSGWIKRGSMSSALQILFNQGSNVNNCTVMQISSSDTISFVHVDSGSNTSHVVATPNFRDPAAWYHLVFKIDTTQSTAADRVKIYVNGEEQSYSTTTYPSLNMDTDVNTTDLSVFGQQVASTPYSFDGYLAEMHFIDGQALTPASFGETNEDTNQWQPKNPTDIKQAVTFGMNGFYLPFSNDALATSFTDSADHSIHTITANGDAHTDTSVKKIGTASAEFVRATSDYLSVPDSDDWDFGTGDFTLECWIRPSSVEGRWINSFESSSSRFYFGDTSTGNVTFVAYNGSRIAYYTSTGTEVSGLDTWYHVAAVRNGTNFYIFVDGVSLSLTVTDAIGTNAMPNVASTLDISKADTTYYDGYMDEIRISHTARYTSTFTTFGQGGGTISSPTAFTADSNTMLLLHCDGSDSGTTFTDSSWTGAPRHTITANGNTTNQRVSNHSVSANADAHIIGPKVGASAMNFDGSSRLVVADSSGFAFGSGNFTIECWINFTSISALVRFIHWHQDGNNRGGFQWSPTYGFQWFMESGASSVIDFNQGGSSAQQYMWHHVALVRNSNTFTIYQDGISVATTTDSDSMPDYTVGPTIGEGPSDGILTGYMDEIRISKGVARYTANFTPDTTAFTSDSDTSLLIHSNAAMGNTTFTDSSSNALTITNSNTVHVAPKIGTGMGAFDGTTDYLTSPTSPSWDFGGGDFTIEFWTYVNALPGVFAMFAERDSNATNKRSWNIGLYPTGKIDASWNTDGTSGGWVSITTTGTVSAGAWTHIAWVKNGSTSKVYINGTADATTSTNSGAVYNSDRGISIGAYASNTYSLDGYIDDLRISRTAQYTSNFTAPTTAFKDVKDTVLLLHMDGGGGIDAATNLPTLPGQGTYFWDASTNAIFYGADGIPTNKSIISFDGTGDYLSIPYSADWNFAAADFTLEMWVNFSTINSYNTLLSHFDDASSERGWVLRYNSSGTALLFRYTTDGSTEIDLTSSALSLTVGQWYHIAVTRQSTNIRFYLDGVAKGSSGISTNTIFNPSQTLLVGVYNTGTDTHFLTGDSDQIRISNTNRYPDGTTFTPSTTPFTADANTKLLIQSDFSEGGLGADHSGNYNYFTPTNLVASDMMEDSPKNNYCTLNPLFQATYGTSTHTFSEGNLKWHSTSNSMDVGTIGIASGKWYWEINQVANNHNTTYYGIIDSSDLYAGAGDIFTVAHVNVTASGDNNTSITKDNSTVQAANLPNLENGDILGIAYNADGLEIEFYVNNSKIGTTQSVTSPPSNYYVPMVTNGNSSGTKTAVMNFGQDSSFAGEKTAQGNQDGNDKGDFYYTPPTGFLALCTDNLADPLIALPKEHFNNVLYTGTGAELSVTGVGFQPDWTWIKTRQLAYNHRVFDVARGVTKELYINDTDAEVTDAQSLKSFDSDGFTLGTGSGSNPSSNMISWNWKAGGTPTVDNSAGVGEIPTAGSVKINGANMTTALAGLSAVTRLSANTTNGFSIAEIEIVSGNITYAHGLSQAPELVIFKAIGSGDWYTQWAPLGNTTRVMLNTGVAAYTGSSSWGSTSPTASVVSASINHDNPSISYCFHSVEGYSKVGRYYGNGNADGPFIFTGFEPELLILKNPDASETWFILDGKIPISSASSTVAAVGNPRNEYMHPNTNAKQNGPSDGGAFELVDFLSNGFKWRSSTAAYNQNNIGIIYVAFAKSPFKTSNAR